MNSHAKIVDGIDIPLTQLKPRYERAVNQKEYARVAASIDSVGLIEPLVVYQEGLMYVILDGHLRYRILKDKGVSMAPCILWKEKESFTSNRMVNRLTAVQEARMITKSLEELDAGTIARALGISDISHRLNKTMLKQLHPKVAQALDEEKIRKTCAQELTYVTPKRQAEILTTMESYDDFSVIFARGLI